MHRGEYAGGEEWTVVTELLAQAVDALNLVASDRVRKGTPKPVPRPKPLARARPSTPAEIAAFFSRRR